MRRGRVLVALGVVTLIALIAIGPAVRLLRPPAAPPVWGDEYDLSAVPPEGLAPGTVVGRAAPDGWSHLVIKSLPRVRPSEVPRVPGVPLIGSARTVQMVAWMFTAFTADVVPERQNGHVRYRLRAIGLGLGTSVNGRDTVITPETAKRYGADMDWVKDEVLRTGYRIQRQAVVAVHGPSFALLDTPVIVRCGTKHRFVRYRYALLVDAKTGGLDVLLWRLAGDAGCDAPARAAWIEPNCIDEVELVPAPDEFRGGFPSDVAFAVDKLPPHRVEMPFPAELLELVAKTQFGPDEARTLEDGLRAMTTGPRP